MRNKIKIIYCCIECGDKISRTTALYRRGLCTRCASLGERNPNYGKDLSGKNNPMYGKKHTKETKNKISTKNKGNKYFLGKKHSEETKIKKL